MCLCFGHLDFGVIEIDFDIRGGHIMPVRVCLFMNHLLRFHSHHATQREAQTRGLPTATINARQRFETVLLGSRPAAHQMC